MTLAAKNLEGTGPRASIELRTEDGGGEILKSWMDTVDRMDRWLGWVQSISWVAGLEALSGQTISDRIISG